MRKRVAVAMVVALPAPPWRRPRAPGSGQAPSDSPQGRRPHSRPIAGTSATGDTRPATTTFMGDTGLWFVPTGEVLPAKKWSVSAYRVNYDYNQGFTDVSELAGDVRRSASAIARRSSARGRWSAASTATSVRSSCRSQPEAGGVIERLPVRASGLVATTSSATSGSAPRSTCSSEYASSRWRSPCAAWSSCRPRRTTTKASAPARRTSRSTPSSARKSTSGSSCPVSAASIFRGDPDDFDLSNGLALGLRRRVPDPQAPPAHGGAARRTVLRRLDHATPAPR